MKALIKTNTKLFLMNFESLKLIGPFIPNGLPGRELVKGAFGGKFCAHVRVTPCPSGLQQATLDRKLPAGAKDDSSTRALLRMLQDGSPHLSSVQTSAVVSPPATGTVRAGSRGPEPPAKRQKQMPGRDKEGREYDLTTVVVNFCNVGASYADRVLSRDKNKGDRLFDWEGVRRCVTCLTKELGLKAVGCIFENYWGPDNGSAQTHGVPDDIRRMCSSVQETPRVTGRNHKSADDEMTIKCAYRRNCRFMDNDNYRDWLKELQNDKIRNWLENCQELLQMRYFFDTDMGTFDTLDGNIPSGLLAQNSPVASGRR
jgi:hypothetical protein